MKKVLVKDSDVKSLSKVCMFTTWLALLLTLYPFFYKMSTRFDSYWVTIKPKKLSIYVVQFALPYTCLSVWW